jgi:hypothetical protein
LLGWRKRWRVWDGRRHRNPKQRSVSKRKRCDGQPSYLLTGANVQPHIIMSRTMEREQFDRLTRYQRGGGLIAISWPDLETGFPGVHGCGEYRQRRNIAHGHRRYASDGRTQIEPRSGYPPALILYSVLHQQPVIEHT